jgi:hypothetical protein
MPEKVRIDVESSNITDTVDGFPQVVSVYWLTFIGQESIFAIPY